jgi:23S rRNA pseudouridine1911/1915/1917 synthase
VADQIEIQIPGDLDGERLDKALASTLEVSRAIARALVDEGVTVDGVPAKPGDRVRTGSVVVSPHPATEWELEPEPVPFDVLYEDDSVLVVDKPAGVVVHPGSGRRHGTLAAGLLHRFPDLRGVGQADRWGLVHRLDKDTSGALVVARTPESFETLTTMLREREIRRDYLALVDGRMSAPTGTIEAPIGRDAARPTRRAVVADGKSAVTHYEVSREFPDFDCTLLKVRLETGRTHQIRVHLVAIDHPVIGDRVYGTKNTRVKAPRVFLHAAGVEFAHPVTGAAVLAESPLPTDLRSVLDSLGNGET